MQDFSDLPPPYSECVQIPWHLNYVDIMPARVDTSILGSSSADKYEKFCTLVQKANVWLRQNADVKVKTCETITVKERDTAGATVNTEDSAYVETGEDNRTTYIRCLRLWIVLKEFSDDKNTAQQIEYVDVIPGKTPSTFDEVITKFNDKIRRQPLPGEIITVETESLKAKYESIDTSSTCWRTGGIDDYMYCVRIFYRVGPTRKVQLGCADFIPRTLSRGGYDDCSRRTYEPLDVVVRRANDWIQQQTQSSVVNVQTVNYKMKTNDSMVDTQKVSYHQGKRTYYLRIVRVYYTTSLEDPVAACVTRQPLCLTYKSFVPAQVQVFYGSPEHKFETQSQTLQRAMAWLKITGNRIVSAETVPFRLSEKFQQSYGDITQKCADPEVTFTSKGGLNGDKYVYILRVFLNGYFSEPPQSDLPVLPQVLKDEESCCDCGDDCVIL